MNEIKTEDLESGSILSGELYLTNDENFILSGYGTLLPVELITALKTWGFTTLYTTGSGDFIADNHVGEKVEFDSTEDEGRDFARRHYQQFYKEAQTIYDSFRTSNEINVSKITELIKAIIASLKEQKRFILRFNEYTDLRKDYFIGHAVETTILSLAMGEHLKIPPYRLIELGTSAFLHEVGLLRMPKTFLEANRALTDEERRVLSAHVVVGFKLLRDVYSTNHQPANFPIDVLMGVLQHHERLDGSGYVQGLKGDQISLYASIIGIACSYHAQIAERPFRGAKGQHLSIVEMVKSMGKQYDERLLKFLLQTISLYPIGSGVKLSDGSIGQVVDADPDNPLHPTVRIISDANGTPLPIERNIVLNDSLRVTGVLKDDDLKIR